MQQRFTARAAVVGNRAGTVVPDAVVDVADGQISWVGPVGFYAKTASASVSRVYRVAAKRLSPSTAGGRAAGDSR